MICDMNLVNVLWLVISGILGLFGISVFNTVVCAIIISRGVLTVIS